MHGHGVLKPQENAVLGQAMRFLYFFPGVPVFFTVSGFLIYWAYERNAGDVRGFFKNRALRIYPGLWVSFAITIILLSLFQQLTFATLDRTDFWGWVARQVSFFQFGTPEIFRHWGDGQVNRSLWTISVELQFYFLLPLIYGFLRWFGTRWAIGWAILFCGSIGVFALQSQVPKGNIVGDIRDLCVTTYLFNFLFGIAFYRLWDRLRFLVEGRFLYWLAAYFLYLFVCGRALGWYHTWPYSPNPSRIVGYLLLSMLTLSLAFSFSSFSERFIKGFDISYGVYIYHGLVLNCFIAFGWMYRSEFVFLLLAVSYALGGLSWVLVEKPILGLKNRASNAVPRNDVRLEFNVVAPQGSVAK
mgnify:CR=1 FL=1